MSSGAVALYIFIGVVTPFISMAFIHRFDVDSLWCRQDTTVHLIVQKRLRVVSIALVMSRFHGFSDCFQDCSVGVIYVFAVLRTYRPLHTPHIA